MKKPILLIISFLALAVAVYVYFNFLKTSPSMHRQEASSQITAEKLYEEFEADEVAANSKYLNKVVEVSGLIESIDVPEGELPTILIQTGGFGLVKATLEHAEELDNNQLAVNEHIKIRGECIGLLLDVLIINSVILNE